MVTVHHELHHDGGVTITLDSTSGPLMESWHTIREVLEDEDDVTIVDVYEVYESPEMEVRLGICRAVIRFETDETLEDVRDRLTECQRHHDSVVTEFVHELPSGFRLYADRKGMTNG